MAVAVRLACVGGQPADVELFAADVGHRNRGQLLDDLAAAVEAEAQFLPVRGASGVQLLAKHAIAWIAVRRRADGKSADAGESGEELMLFDHQHLVEIELLQGVRLSGTLLDSAPMDRSRAIDHLNRAGRFLRMWTADEHYLINTRQIVAVTELGEVW